jgi:hypothetical protein
MYGNRCKKSIKEKICIGGASRTNMDVLDFATRFS